MPPQAMAGHTEEVLRPAVLRQASDICLTSGAPIPFKIAGVSAPRSDQVLTPAQVHSLLTEAVSADHLVELDATGDLSIRVDRVGVGVFRRSAFRQSGSMAAVLRCVPRQIPALSSLGLPAALESLILERRGLLLMAGATGTGKRTTLAAMLDHRNQSLPGHILTIEDPVEFRFTHKKSVMNQREVGGDTASLHVALKNALRQAADVVLIGEIRDRETMSAAVSHALSDHLVVATLHAHNSFHAQSLVPSLYATDARAALVTDPAAGLKAIIAQRRLRGPGSGRAPAVEVIENQAHLRTHRACGLQRGQASHGTVHDGGLSDLRTGPHPTGAVRTGEPRRSTDACRLPRPLGMPLAARGWWQRAGGCAGRPPDGCGRCSRRKPACGSGAGAPSLGQGTSARTGAPTLCGAHWKMRGRPWPAP